MLEGGYPVLFKVDYLEKKMMRPIKLQPCHKHNNSLKGIKVYSFTLQNQMACFYFWMLMLKLIEPVEQWLWLSVGSTTTL